MLLRVRGSLPQLNKAKNGPAGGADAIINPRLALALSIAKKAGFPKASIDSAILRGQGRSASGAPLENMTIEAVIPPVGLIIECQTDSKARTLQDLRGMLKNHGGTQSPAAYLFEKRGRITFQSKEGVGVDEVLDAALEAGALDVTADDTGRLVLDTVVESTAETETRLVQQMGLEVESSDTLYFPNADTKIDSVEPATLEVLRKLQDALEEYPGVHGVYMNFDIEGAYADIENAAVDAQ